MPIRKPKPTSPGRRFVTYADFAEVTKTKPEKTLVEGLTKSGGRNANGRKTARHRGGGAKRLYRQIDFKRRKDGVPARVAAIEYDPNRSAYIALLHYVDGEKAYILAPNRLRVGMTVTAGPGSDITVGNAMYDDRFGSYSMAATFAGTPSLRARLKSILRYRRLAPPPRWREVLRPWALRPPDLVRPSTRVFSGSVFVISA